MGLELVRAIGAAAAFAWIFLSGLLVAPFVACAAGVLAARRLGGRFTFADGLLFGAAGGLLGGPLALWAAASYARRVAGAIGAPGELARAAVGAMVPGLVAGLVIGACMGVGAAWPKSRAPGTPGTQR